MYYILRILQITFGDLWKAIQFAIQKPYSLPYEKGEKPYKKLYRMAKKPYVAIQIAVQDGKKAIHCHTKSHTVRQKSHTLPYRLLYKMAKKPYSAIRIAILYSKRAIQLPYKKLYSTAKMPYTKKDNKNEERTKWKN